MKRFSKRCKRILFQAPTPLLWRAAVATLAVTLGYVAALSWAAYSQDRPSTLENNEASRRQPTLSRVNVTIAKKSLQHIFTLRSKFAVNKETLIVGTDGKEVKLKKMLVPCDAVVSYRIENGTPTAKRIDIRRVALDARWQWMAEHPE